MNKNCATLSEVLTQTTADHLTSVTGTFFLFHNFELVATLSLHHFIEESCWMMLDGLKATDVSLVHWFQNFVEKGCGTNEFEVV